jgi:hypothetical protein
VRRSKELGHATISSGSSTLYTAPAGSFAIVKNIVSRNYGSSDVLMTVTFTLESGTDYGGLDIWLKGGGVQYGSRSDWAYLVVPPSGHVKVQGGNGSCVVTLFGVEMPS